MMRPLRPIRRRSLLGMALGKFSQVKNLTKSIRHEKTLIPAKKTTPGNP